MGVKSGLKAPAPKVTQDAGLPVPCQRKLGLDEGKRSESLNKPAVHDIGLIVADVSA